MSRFPIAYIERGKARMAQMALEQQLFHKRGVLREAFEHAQQQPQHYSIVAAVCHNRMIGVCLIDRYNNINCFVKRSHRRRGIGSFLVEKARQQWMRRTHKEECELTSYSGHDPKGSLKFWRRNAVLNINDRTEMRLKKKDLEVMVQTGVDFQWYLLEHNRQKYVRLKQMAQR